MNKFKITLFLLFFISNTYLFSQIGGNQIYGSKNKYHYNYSNSGNHQKRTIYTTDSTVTFKVSILLNTIADTYILTIGVSQESNTVSECNSIIDKRIEKALSSMKSIGINKDKAYVDFISQTKIYDYSIDKNTAEQHQSGFEIKKNIILKLDKIEKIDEIITICAQHQIYNIIKVDYILNSTDQHYASLFERANSLIDKKKELFLKYSTCELTGESRVIEDKLYTISPKTQYEEYTAFESSNVSSNYTNNQYINKEVRKSSTFYYNGLDQSNFDQTINNHQTKVGLQLVFEVSKTFNIKQ